MQPFTNEGTMRLFEVKLDKNSTTWVNLDSVVKAMYASPAHGGPQLTLELPGGDPVQVRDASDIKNIALILGITIP
jgi:hypothetical protein